MRESGVGERFLVSLIVMVGVSWVLGLVNVFLALAGPFVAGMVFARFRAGVRRKHPAQGAAAAGLAIGVMIAPVAALPWFLLTATSDPGEAHNLFEALTDLESNGDRALATIVFVLASVGLGASGGALSAWLHGRQLEREYWVNEE